MPRINYNKIRSDLSMVEDNFASPILTGILTLLVIFYSSFVASSFSPEVAGILNNPFVRIAFLFLVLTVRMYNPLASFGILAVAFVVLTLGYVMGPAQPAAPAAAPRPVATAAQLEHDRMVNQLRKELEESVEESVESSSAASVESDVSSELEAQVENTATSGGALSNFIKKIAACVDPKSTRRVGIADYEKPPANLINNLEYPPYRVEHPDSPVHMSHNPKQPYGAYNSHLSNVDVDLAKLNPPFTVKNLPLHHGKQGSCVLPEATQPHLATPHADDKPALRPIQLSESAQKIASRLNPPVEGFTNNDSCAAAGTCDVGGSSKKKNFYSKNYHLTGGSTDPLSHEFIHRKYAENETALNNIIQTNMGVLISALIAELKYTLTEKEIREGLCDIIKTILKHRNTTLREFFNHEETYRSFVRLVLLVAEKVENSTSMSIIHDVFSDVLKQMRHIVAEKLDTNVARRIGDISDIREKAKKVNLDQICNFPAETIGLNNGIQLYGGAEKRRGPCETLPCHFRPEDPVLPETDNLGQVVSANLHNSGAFFGPQGQICPTGYPGVKYGAEFVHD